VQDYQGGRIVNHFKKTATLTFQNTENYGASLQCYALHKALIKNGVENDVLNYQCKYMDSPYGISALKRKGFIRFFLGIIYSIIRMPRRKKFNEFRALINTTSKLNICDLEKLEKNYDAFIAGSDQVWNDSITNLDSSYYFDFVKSAEKKLSYAASFGFEEIPNSLKEKYTELLKDFSVFNMRETSGVKNIETLLSRPANLVLDPTMLLTAHEWDEIALSPKSKYKYILVYQTTVSSFLIKTAKALSRATGYRIITIPFPLGGFLRGKLELTAGPREFVGLIRDAEIVVTDSFHGSTFSILYNKKFYVCLTDAPTRILSLLNLFNLRDFIHSPSSEVKLERKIDWLKINKKIDFERSKSIGFIEEMLNI
jgi:hypothetical protein